MKNETWNPFLKNKNSLDKLEEITCPKCNNTVFDRYYKLYKLSAFDNVKGIPQVYNSPVFVCAQCAEILNIESAEEKKIEDNTPTNK